MKKIVLLFFVSTLLLFNVYSQEIGIKVNTSIGGILFFEGREVTSLFDNDSYTIPIERPGTYSIRIKFANGRESTKSVVISARGIVEIGFLMPPSNVRIGTVGMDSLPILWDAVVGTRITYNVYYNTENHSDSAIVQKNISATNVTLQSLAWNRTYYVWVSVTEDGIEGAKSQMLSQQLVQTRLGQMGPAGGIIFYDKGVFSDGWQYLEVAPANTEVKIPWARFINHDSYPNVGNQTDIGTGRSNTKALVNFYQRIGVNDTAMQYCDNLIINGFDDWFMPSINELKMIYDNLIRRRLDSFQNDNYWSSTKYNLDTRGSYAYWAYYLTSSGETTVGGYNIISASSRVRAIRAF